MTSEYYLKVNWEVVNKILKKYPKPFKSKIKRDISLLKYNPKKGTMIDSFRYASLWKKRYEEVEIYYTIEDFFVVVLGIEYVGTVEIQNLKGGIKGGKHRGKSTTKQKESIRKEKNKFSKKYRESKCQPFV